VKASSRLACDVQTMILTHRALVDASRNLGVYWIRLAMYIMMAVMFGLFWCVCHYGPRDAQPAAWQR
jgi:hypothetical protein